MRPLSDRVPAVIAGSGQATAGAPDHLVRVPAYVTVVNYAALVTDRDYLGDGGQFGARVAYSEPEGPGLRPAGYLSGVVVARQRSVFGGERGYLDRLPLYQSAENPGWLAPLDAGGQPAAPSIKTSV